MLRTKQTVETPKDRMALVHDAGMGKVSGVSVVSGTLVAYGAFLVGPLIIGFTAQHLSLPAALGIIVVALLCVAGGSVVLRRTGG